MARRLLAQRISTWPALAQRQALRDPEGQRGGDPALGERSIQGRRARRHRPSLDSVHRSAGVAPLLGTPQTSGRPPTAHPGAGAAGEGATRIPREKGPWGGGNEGGRSAEPSGNRPRLFPGGGGAAGLRFQTPLSSTQRGMTCLVTPSSLLLKGRGGSLGRARGGRPGRRFAMSALCCVPPSAPGSRPQPSAPRATWDGPGQWASGLSHGGLGSGGRRDTDRYTVP